MKRADIEKLSKSELELKLKENQDALLNLRFQKVLQQLEHPQKIRTTKREIAQLLTVIREFDMGIRGKESR
jgi:large subunit ribosomal protein L29